MQIYFNVITKIILYYKRYMTTLKEIGVEHLEGALIIAFCYTDDTIIWIMIEGGEVVRTLKQKSIG
jgi:hypothetical protein